MSGSLFPTREHELLSRIREVLAPLDSKIDHSLWVGTKPQMRQDLAYIRGLLDEARKAIDAELAE